VALTKFVHAACWPATTIVARGWLSGRPSIAGDIARL
jgi:hypothetical protein